MENLLTAWPEVMPQFRQARQILLLTDFDGTLTPIVERPELAHIPESTRLLLRALTQNRRIKLGIISGRALADIKHRVNVKGIIYAGNHGFEIEGPGLNFISPLASEIQPFFRRLSQYLVQALESTKGVLIENKGLTLSVHYRQIAAGDARDMRNAFYQVVNNARSEGKFKITPGKKVYELRPDINWDKGQAISLILQKLVDGHRKNPVLPVYLGDDLTDEDGFRAIYRYGSGITVHIGNHLHSTSANYFLKSPEEVIEFLKLVHVSLQKDFRI